MTALFQREVPQRDRYDAIVIGSGPNGFAAAITMAAAGHSVLLLEARETIGGGMRSGELTLPGFVHDICSAIQPFAVASRFFRDLPLAQYGLEWIHAPAPLAHPLDDGTAAMLERSVEATAATLGLDGAAYRRLMGPFVKDWGELADDLLGPFPIPRHPFLLSRFGLSALRSARGLAEHLFKGEAASAIFAGVGAHSILPLEAPLTSAIALVLSLNAHAIGWPMARGGSQKIADALACHLRSLGGEIITGTLVESLDQLPPARAILCDVGPRGLARIARDRLPAGYRHKLMGYRYGPGVFKLDLALDGPIPWKAPECARASTVHVGGTLPEIASGERDVWSGKHPERPFVLLAQQSLFDSTRAPEGKHTVWAYCHVPNGSAVDMTERIEAQIERFAPGFRDRILARSAMGTVAMEQYNPNYVGGDINAGVQDWRQFFSRPTLRLVPYSTPVKGLYICSSSTPPGGGVHGMCGFHAARAALRALF